MSTNPNKPTGSAIFNFLPGTVTAPGIEFMNIGGVSGAYFQVSHDLTTRFVTKSINNPLHIADFDVFSEVIVKDVQINHTTELQFKNI